MGDFRPWLSPLPDKIRTPVKTADPKHGLLRGRCTCAHQRAHFFLNLHCAEGSAASQPFEYTFPFGRVELQQNAWDVLIWSFWIKNLKKAAVENEFSRFLFHLSWLLSGRLISQGNIMALVLRFLPILLVIAVLLLFFRRSRGKKMPFPAAQGGNGKLFLTLGATLVAFVLFVMGAELITRL